MANRKNTFLIKRSSTPGKVPTAGDLLLGELALNTADVILYASGTTSNSILPIGWDRVARSGDTMTGTLKAPALSATTISAVTYIGLPTDVRVTGFSYNNNTFTISDNTGGTFNSLFNTITGVTVNGNVSITGATSTNTLTATTLSSTTITVSGVTFNKLLLEKVGSVDGGSFAGNPKKTTITFGTNFPSSTYSIIITGTINRTYTYESQASSGFTINANANGALTGNVYWIAKQIGEV